MKIGVIGSGDVAKVLASGFLKHGHDVVIGTRDPAKLKDWAERNPGARVGSFSDAAQFGEVVALAVKGLAAAEALRAAGTSNLADKPLIDATNPIAEAAPQNGVLQYFSSLDESLMERLQREFPNTRFVKAFNSVGNSHMVNPQFAGGKPTMFICGNDNSAKKTVETILDQFGWETADMGKAEAARAIEPRCMLWCIPGFCVTNGRTLSSCSRSVDGRTPHVSVRRAARMRPTPSIRTSKGSNSAPTYARFIRAFGSLAVREATDRKKAAGIRIAAIGAPTPAIHFQSESTVSSTPKHDQRVDKIDAGRAHDTRTPEIPLLQAFNALQQVS